MLNFNNHSLYTYKNAIATVDEIAEHALESGLDSFCITDRASVTSFAKAFKAAEKKGLKFIPGLELNLKPNEFYDKISIEEKMTWNRRESGLKRTTEEMKAQYIRENEELSKIDLKSFDSLILLAKNNDGLVQLIEILNSEKYFEVDGYKVLKEELFKQKSGNIIVISGSWNSEIVYFIQRRQFSKARKLMIELKDHFGDDFYIQLSFQFRALHLQDEDRGLLSEREVYLKMSKMAEELKIKTVAVNESYYVGKSEYDRSDFRLFLNINYPNEYLEFNFDGAHIPSEKEMTEKLTAEYGKKLAESSMKTIKEIESKIQIMHFPKARNLEDKRDDLYQLCLEGWEKTRKGTSLEKESWDRFHYELEVINNRNFSKYFTNVIKIIEIARELGILVSPGRGSGPGSEVCYLTEITGVDPLKYGLFFERFLNPDRNGYPDIDIDMSSVSFKYPDIASRDLLMKELVERGVFKFAGFINNEVRTSQLSLLKSVARYLSIPPAEANKITTDAVYAEFLSEKTYSGWLKSVVDELGLEWEDVWDEVEKRMDFCYRRAKIPFNSSVASSGVIMTEENVTLPFRDDAIGFNGDDLEMYGYIKYDLLSVNNLNSVAEFRGMEFDWNSNEDEKVWDTILNGDTDFVFQFSSTGMKRILQNGLNKVYKDVVDIKGLGTFKLDDTIKLKDESIITAEELYNRIQNGEEIEI